MALATATPQAAPSARFVLVKRIDPDGIVFFSNTVSRKGADLEANPRAEAVFWWDALGRQMRVAGPVSCLPDAENDAYWATRPRESQLSAAASRQSRRLDRRADLVARRRELARRFADEPVPRPAYWVGYKIRATRVEFWQDEPGRLHRRELFTLARGEWRRRLLQP